MPWTAGVYTRGYPSWTNDANNNLPISATKFDLEDNDFAAGLNNCLTIDGTNKPTATLSWTQQIALTRSTDGSLLSIARTAGVNNPSLTWSVTETGNHVSAKLNTGNNALDLVPTAYTFGNATDNPSYSFTGSGTAQFAGQVQSTVSGAAASGGFLSVSTLPAYGLRNTGGATDGKIYDFASDQTTQAAIRLVNDAANSSHDVLRWARSGLALTSLVLGNTTDTAPVSYATASANREIGFRNAEPNPQTTPYALLSSDAGRIVDISATAGGNITVNQLTAGTAMTVVNGSSGTINLVQGSGVTLRLGNSAGVTGNRTLGQWGAATLYWGSTTVVYCFGAGVS